MSTWSQHEGHPATPGNPGLVNPGPITRTVVTTVSSDAHTWNLIFLQLFLEEHGHEVMNLGPCVPDDLLEREVLSQRPDLIVISSVNGHGQRDGLRVIKLLRRHSELAQTRIVIGGKLGIDGCLSRNDLSRLMQAGYDAVFADGCDIHELLNFVRELPPPPGAP